MKSIEILIFEITAVVNESGVSKFEILSFDNEYPFITLALEIAYDLFFFFNEINGKLFYLQLPTM